LVWLEISWIQLTPDMTSELPSDMIAIMTHDMTSALTNDMTPDMTTDMIPDMRDDVTPGLIWVSFILVWLVISEILTSVWDRAALIIFFLFFFIDTLVRSPAVSLLTGGLRHS
jgi:hypothetical protein